MFNFGIFWYIHGILLRASLRVAGNALGLWTGLWGWITRPRTLSNSIWRPRYSSRSAGYAPNAAGISHILHVKIYQKFTRNPKSENNRIQMKTVLLRSYYTGTLEMRCPVRPYRERPPTSIECPCYQGCIWHCVGSAATSSSGDPLPPYKLRPTIKRHIFVRRDFKNIFPQPIFMILDSLKRADALLSGAPKIIKKRRATAKCQHQTCKLALSLTRIFRIYVFISFQWFPLISNERNHECNGDI